MRDLVFVVGLLSMLPFVFGRPHVGVLLWCWTALLVPNFYVFGFASSIPYNLIVAIFTLLVWAFSKEPVRISVNRTTVLLILFGLFGAMSASFAIGNREAAWAEWEKLVKMIIFAVVVSSLMNSRARIEALVYAICLSLGFHGVVEGLKFLASGGGHHIYGPGASIIGDNNHFALAMLCTLPLLFFLYRQTSHRALKLGILGSAAILSFSVVGTFSRGGLIGLLAIGVWSFLHSARKVRFLALLIPLAFAIFSFAPERWFERMDTIATADQDSSFMGRVIAWKQSTLIALDNPVLGGGFQALQNFSVWKLYSLKFAELDFIPTDEPDTLRPHAAHSIYFQVLGDLGFVGLALFVTLGLIAWRNSIVVIRKARRRKEIEWTGQLAQYIQYSLIAYFVAGAALSMAYFELMFVLFAVLASLRQIVDRKDGDQAMVAGMAQ